jgi:hypothetical protein
MFCAKANFCKRDMFVFANTAQKNNCSFKKFGAGCIKIFCLKLCVSFALPWNIRDKMASISEHHNAPPVDGGKSACICQMCCL